MTVVVGVLCEDGVVVGSDSSATMAAGQFRTVEQPVRKTCIISDHIIMAGTGQVGMGQRFEHVLEVFRKQKKFENSDKFSIAKGVAAEAIKDFGSTNAQPGNFGALVAFQCADGFHLCEFALADMQPEFKTDDQWFCCMGSGQPITDPLMGMLRRVFFDGQKPKLNEGIFAVTWALNHAIELNTGGINGPMQIGVLSTVPPKTRMTARLLSDDEIQEHVNNVEAAEVHIARYRRLLAGEGDTEPLPSPPPSS